MRPPPHTQQNEGLNPLKKLQRLVRLQPGSQFFAGYTSVKWENDQIQALCTVFGAMID